MKQCTNIWYEKAMRDYWIGFKDTHVKIVLNDKSRLNETLDYYLNTYAYPRIQALSNKEFTGDQFLSFINQFLEPAEDIPKGCFIIKACTQYFENDSSLQGYLMNYLNIISGGIEKSISRSRITNISKSEIHDISKNLAGIFSNVMASSDNETLEINLAYLKEWLYMMPFSKVA